MTQEISKKSRKRNGLEMIVAGGALLLSKFLLATLAPILVCVFGLYRGLFRKRFVEGTFYVVAGIALWLMLRWTPLVFLIWIPMLIGVVILIYGLILVFGSSNDG